MDHSRPTIAYTYSVVTPKSAEQGDYADHGFYDPSLGGFSLLSPDVEQDTRDNPDLYWQPWEPGMLRKAIQFARDHGCTETDGSGSFYTVDPEPNYRSGEETSHAVHFNGFRNSTLERIARCILA